MWTDVHRRTAERKGLRYPSDLSEAEWRLVEPLIPPAKRGGRKRSVNIREVLNGIFYVLSTGCQWKALPKDLPPKSTVYDYLDLWSWDGTLARIHHELYVSCREQAGREAREGIVTIEEIAAIEMVAVVGIWSRKTEVWAMQRTTPVTWKPGQPSMRLR